MSDEQVVTPLERVNPPVDDGADPDREQHEAEHGRPRQTFEVPPTQRTLTNLARTQRTIE